MIPIEQEPFIGMWRDRSDMKDSTIWVRHLRAAEWGHAEARRGPSPSHARLAPSKSER
jgi:hypothetical protein